MVIDELIEFAKTEQVLKISYEQRQKELLIWELFSRKSLENQIA
ncbi:hypothetical protein VCRA2126O85_10330 [Vibrio crassostreae]|nr:hypothetical protein VCRA2126O84_10104 [Vibrio crassostreae]CAK2699157.1 hypothetical protein VCRA2127O91_10104 [Vibrio crassostreae]CAK2719250.1 hypothetical protein VCRA2128O100_10330 [Vibrio crassostreae]CAK2721516.1 hypothetical protein VCRA2128O106_10330 [Vibrio crassostreae]CAK2722350.1 hypothetical protein VCRA2125O83_10330 [Vibrio crassostreae]